MIYFLGVFKRELGDVTHHRNVCSEKGNRELILKSAEEGPLSLFPQGTMASYKLVFKSVRLCGTKIKCTLFSHTEEKQKKELKMTFFASS